MFFTLVGPMGHEHDFSVASKGMNLGAMLDQYAPAVEACFVNGRPLPEWQRYIPNKGDHARIHLRTGAPLAGFLVPVITALGASEATAAALAPIVANAIISTVISTTLGLIVQALSPQPKAAKLDGNQSQSYGISGFQNTTGQGVPIPVYWGEQRVLPHIIAGGIDVSADHKNMIGRVLYCVGDSMGDEYESLTDVEIDDLPVEQYEGVTVHTRLGSMTQTAIPEFENVSTPWFVGQTVPWDDATNTGSAIFYSTRASNVNRAGVTFAFPGGLWRINGAGKHRAEIVSMAIHFRNAAADPNVESNWNLVRPGDGEWVGDPNYFHFEDNQQSAIYFKINIDFSGVCQAAANRYWSDYPDVAADGNYNGSPQAAYIHFVNFGRAEGRVWHSELCTGQAYVLRFLIGGSHVQFPDDEPHSATMQLYNVEETIFTTQTYPGYVLLGLTGIPAKQIKSLQSMKTSVLVKGKKVTIPGLPTKVYTRKRAWIVRDMMVGPCGMNYEFDDTEIDDAQWANESSYHDENVMSQNGVNLEPRDLCDVACTNRKWDWDWVKLVAGEGRATIFPSGPLWKFVIDRPGSPNLLFCEPGNVIENSIQIELGPLDDDPYTEIIGEFRDSQDGYNAGLTDPIYADPNNPPPSVLQKAVHFDTITRESQAHRECQVIIKRQYLERRRWQIVTPMGKIVSEPWDLDYLSERNIGDIGAYTGVLPAGSTTSNVVFDQPVTLESSVTYLLIVQKRDNSPAQSRTVSTGAGTWMSLATTSPFAVAPAEGDWYAMGQLNLDHIVTRCQDVKIDGSGRVSQVRTEYNELVYTPDPLPSRRERRRFPYVGIPPLPLRDASVTNEVVLRKDGTWGAVLIFDAMPGLISQAGTMVSANVDGVFVQSAVLPPQYQGPAGGAPYQENYFRGAVLTVTDGTAAGIQRNIISYDPNTYFLGLDAGPSVGSVAGQGYRIDWPKFSDTQGFKVESALDANGAPGAFVEIAKQTGFHLERDGGDQGGTWWYRFTPYNVNGVENRVARIVKRVVVSGDLVAPTAPFQVTSTASLQLVTVYVFINNVPLDFAGVDIEVYQFQFVNGQRQIIQILGADQVAAPQSFGNATIQHAFDIRWAGLSYTNTFLYARARSKDWTGNVSAWVQGNDFTFEQVNTLDLGDTSVTIKSTYIDASTMTLATSAETVVGTITITTEGYPIQFASRVTMQHFLAGAALHLRLRRDNAGGTLLDEVLAYANETTTPTTLRGIFALDQRPPGTYVYVMTVIAESSLSPNFSVWDRYLSSVEIKR